MEIKKKYRYAIACPTSMGVRITPEGRQTFAETNRLLMQATSAESNVLNIAASLGHACLVLTRFVDGSPITAFIRSELRKRNIFYEGPAVAQGGPWGYRHQFNIADSGFGLRAPRVWNDRAGEVGRTMDVADFDTERIFAKEGVAILHLSGLIAALSKETTACCLALAKEAAKHGTLISFDLNYRATFWEGREKELHDAFTEIASLADILIGNEEDFQLSLGVKGPEAGGKGLAGKIEGFQGMIGEMTKQFPHASLYATTLREAVSANEHLWGAILYDGKEFLTEEPRPIPVMDRIGGGDGFAGGLLYGILKGYNTKECLMLGWASGVMAASSINDYATPQDEKQLRDIYAGNARVQR